MDNRLIRKKFEDVYRPMVDSYIAKLSIRPATDYAGVPHLFLPAWGKNYPHALIRMAIIGKETYGWEPNLDQFIASYQKEKYDFEKDREKFQNLDFTEWLGGTKNCATFWGFWMNVLAKTYGIDDWKEIRDRKYDVLLDSFLWGNANSIETDTSKGVDPNAPGYRFAKAESAVFDSVDLIKKIFNPHVIILTCASRERDHYLGNEFEMLERVDDRVTVYKKDGLLVFYAPHSNRQRWYTGGSDVFARIMRDLLVKYKMFCPLPNVLQQGLSPEAREILIRECSAEKMDKYEAIAHVALELRKQRQYMTARSLCLDILNKAGHTTDWGTEFTGNCQGPCRLCSTAYHRFVTTEPSIADNIAYAFTKVNGFYAYE